ncbi:hypothetical protein V1264_007015 [Littorina saxatilis]|uniref:PLAT domain-containing protein n=1 Tax=Littorina saxatilis TaxID=31220 RepID=A0AAN9ATW5_9CAEN
MTVKAKAAVMMVAVTMMMIFMTTTNASEGRSLRHRQKRIMCSGGKTVPVRICVQTADGNWLHDRGTDSGVHVSLSGASCRTSSQELESPADDFEQGDYDCFSYNTQNVGTVLGITVQLLPYHDRWLLDSMVLRYNNVRTCLRFTQRVWFTDHISRKITDPKNVNCSDYRL